MGTDNDSRHIEHNGLLREQDTNTHSPAYGLDRYCYQQGENAQFGFTILENIEPSLVAKGGCEVDSSGKKAGKGALIQTNLSATLGVSQDQTLFVPKVLNSSGGGIAGCLDSHYYKGCGEREGIEREFIAIARKGERCGENGTTDNI